jgi:hypothetical protein
MWVCFFTDTYLKVTSRTAHLTKGQRGPNCLPWPMPLGTVDICCDSLFMSLDYEIVEIMQYGSLNNYMCHYSAVHWQCLP